MKAVIMAGGEGSRLRPLTCDLPKPMVRLCGRPVLEYILELLGKHGVDGAALTLRYLPQRITGHFPAGRYGDIPLRFVEEKTPLGTAGSVRNAWAGEEELLVISGDALCDFDLGAFARFHRESGADASILAKRVEDPREYGLINAGKDGRIRGFIEKPAFSQAVSDLANTGIYLVSRGALELIPRDVPFDFAKDLFPLMLQKEMRLMCWEGQGYWCDIGDLAGYASCQRDMLEGRVACRINGRRDAAGNVFAGETPPPQVRVAAPVYLGRNLRLEDGALIESGSVVDDGCYVGPGARVTGSILLPDCYIGARARLTGALIGAGAAVKNGAMLFEGAAVGAGAVVEESASVMGGVKVWNGKRVKNGAVASEHVKIGGGGREYFDDDGIAGQVGVELTPEFCARIGCAVGSLYSGGRIAVGSTSHQSAQVLKAALGAGIQSTGSQVLDLGENFQAQFEYAMNFCAAKVGVFVRGDRRASLKVFAAGGLPATRDIERSLEGILSRGEFVRCSFDQMGDRVELPGISMLYRSQLLRCAPKGLSGCRARVRSRSLAVQDTLRDVLYKLGCEVGGELLIEVSSQGDRVRVCDPEAGFLPHHKILALCALGEMERGRDVAVPFDAPRAIDAMAQRTGRRVLRYFDCPADQSDQEARKLAVRQMWSRDALMQAVMLLHHARRSGGIRALTEEAPEFDRAVRTVETQGSPAGVIRELNTGGGAITEGVLLRRDKGIVLVRPLKRGTGVKIYAEAVNSEFAGELCDDAETLIRKSLQNREEPGAQSAPADR